MTAKRSRLSWSGVVALLFTLVCGALIGLPFKPSKDGPRKRPPVRKPLVTRTPAARPAIPAAPAKPGPHPSPLIQQAVWSLLSPPERGPSPVAGEIAHKIAALGPVALPTVVGILFGELLEPELGEAEPIHPFAVDQRREILLASLSAFPVEDLTECLRGRAEAGTSLGARLCAIDTLGELGDSRAFGVLLEIAARIEPAALTSETVSTQIERALVAILARDPQAFEVLASNMEGGQRSLEPVLARALSRSASSRALPLLSRLFGRSPDLDLALLQALSQAAPLAISDLPEDLAARAREFLDRPDAAGRMAAAAALGCMQDPFACERLIELLDDPDPGVADAALKSLQKISGVQFGLERSVWTDWHEEERQWYDNDASEAAQTLQDEDPGEVVGAIEALVHHPTYRHRAAQDIAPLLFSADEEVASAACAALGQLGSLRAVPSLVEGLRSRDDGFREMCAETLELLTGRDLPAEWSAWQAEMSP